MYTAFYFYSSRHSVGRTRSPPKDQSGSSKSINSAPGLGNCIHYSLELERTTKPKAKRFMSGYNICMV